MSHNQTIHNQTHGVQTPIDRVWFSLRQGLLSAFNHRAGSNMGNNDISQTGIGHIGQYVASEKKLLRSNNRRSRQRMIRETAPDLYQQVRKTVLQPPIQEHETVPTGLLRKST
jgi:hypothetical protein